MKLKKHWREITWQSRVIALMLFFIIFELGLYVGLVYEFKQSLIARESAIDAKLGNFPDISYGTLNFQGNMVAYPSFVDTITTYATTGPMLSNDSNFGNVKLNDVTFTMSVNVVSLKKRDEWVSTLMNTTNTYQEADFHGDDAIFLLYSNDQNVHPQEGAQSCSYDYTAFAALPDKKNVLVLDYNVVNPQWGNGNNICHVFDEDEYQYFKSAIDTSIRKTLIAQ